METDKQQYSAWTVFLVFLRLGLTSFGGPIAHLAYFRDEFVTRRGWLSEKSYADLVGLCQFLPGPASSQVGFALGLLRAGYTGALAAWAGFTLPSVIALITFALGISQFGDFLPVGLIHGLKIVVVAVVAQAVWGMARSFCTDLQRIFLMLAAASTILIFPSALNQLFVIAVSGIIGVLFFKPSVTEVNESFNVRVSRRAAMFWLMLFFGLLFSLPLLSQVFPDQTLAMFDAFYRSGALVFGGGHVVLPLLQAEVVVKGWLSEEVFLAGYGVTQAMPGPLFTFSAFLGASIDFSYAAWVAGLIGLVAIFLPSFFLVAGVLPFWNVLREHAHAKALLAGINTAVVGILAASLYKPVWTGAVTTLMDVVMVAFALIALMRWKIPPWLVVLVCALSAWLVQKLI